MTFAAQDEGERAAARTQWSDIFRRLQMALREAASDCLDEEQRRKYFMSVTEDEVRNGVMAQRDVNAHALCFVRIITAMHEHLSATRAWRYIDVTADKAQLDDDAQAHLQQLRDKLVPEHLQSQNIHRYLFVGHFHTRWNHASVVQWSETQFLTTL